MPTATPRQIWFTKLSRLLWLDDFEYIKLKLPRPDLVIFLDMPPKISEKLISERNHSDIHEKDFEYLHRCYDSYQNLAQKLHWYTIKCSAGNQPRTVEDIHKDIFDTLSQNIF